jgi:hypothetical protein
VLQTQTAEASRNFYAFSDLPHNNSTGIPFNMLNKLILNADYNGAVFMGG